MRKRICLAVFVAMAFPAFAAAQSAFDGTWKMDLSTAKFPEKPDIFLLQDGMYHCKTCVPPIDVKADGQDHAVTGQPYFDSVNVKVVDDHTIIETDKKSGKVVSTAKVAVTPDGNTTIFEFTDSSATNAAPVTGKGEATRVEKGPAGSHLVSGSWRMAKMDNVSDNGLFFTYKTTGDSLTMTTPIGQGYTAKLDGTDAPYKGDPGTTSVSVQKLGASTLKETDKRDGKVIGVTTMIVSSDGKSMRMVTDDTLHGTHSESTATKQ